MLTFFPFLSFFSFFLSWSRSLYESIHPNSTAYEVEDEPVRSARFSPCSTTRPSTSFFPTPSFPQPIMMKRFSYDGRYLIGFSRMPGSNELQVHRVLSGAYDPKVR